ncbi:hypothetical protein BpHYR1_054089, partial [Brachionus plicatilis]
MVVVGGVLLEELSCRLGLLFMASKSTLELGWSDCFKLTVLVCDDIGLINLTYTNKNLMIIVCGELITVLLIYDDFTLFTYNKKTSLYSKTLILFVYSGDLITDFEIIL